jgi:hypothetical protein
LLVHPHLSRACARWTPARLSNRSGPEVLRRSDTVLRGGRLYLRRTLAPDSWVLCEYARTRTGRQGGLRTRERAGRRTRGCSERAAPRVDRRGRAYARIGVKGEDVQPKETYITAHKWVVEAGGRLGRFRLHDAPTPRRDALAVVLAAGRSLRGQRLRSCTSAPRPLQSRMSHGGGRGRGPTSQRPSHARSRSRRRVQLAGEEAATGVTQAVSASAQRRWGARVSARGCAARI